MVEEKKDNLELWNSLRTPPASALRKIGAGRLKGKTDIDPMWRIQRMTEVFGPFGHGWWFTIEQLWTEKGGNDEVACFAKVFLYVKGVDVPIPGVGGNMLVDKEHSGLHTNDEGYKMAITDALGTAMRLLGMAADVYLGKFDDSKYDRVPEQPKPHQAAKPKPAPPATPTPEQVEADPHVFGGGGDATPQVTGGPVPACPVCNSEMWDNRVRRAADSLAYKNGTRKSKPGPAFRCKDQGCQGVVWSYTKWLEEAGVSHDIPE